MQPRLSPALTTRTQRAHAFARLLPLALGATQIAIGRRAFTLEPDDGESLATLLAAQASLFHNLIPPTVSYHALPHGKSNPGEAVTSRIM